MFNDTADEDLMVMYQKGEVRAFEVLLTRHRKPVYNFILRFVGDKETAEDLLYHLPFRYEDRQNPRSLDELKPGDTASVIAEVRGAMLMRTRKMPIFELTVGQGRHALKCLWFHGHYLDGKFHAGQTVALCGCATV